MMQLLELERISQTQKDRMRDAFNAGLGEAQQTYGHCTPGARAEMAALAREGRGLIAKLAPPPPEPGHRRNDLTDPHKQ